MDEKKTDALIEAVTNMVNGVSGAAGQATDFVLEQAPLVIQELILWKRVEHTLWLAISIVLLIALAFFVWKNVVKISSIISEGDDPFPRVMCTAVGGVVSLIIGLEMLFSNLTPCLQVWLAPRLYLIEYAADILR